MADYSSALPVRNGESTGDTELKVTVRDATTPSQSLAVDSSGAINVKQATAADLNATVTGTVTANAGTGNFTVVQATGTNLHAVIDSGTVTANIGTTGGLALDATLTGGSQKTKLVDSAGTNLASISAAGALKVDGSAVTQPVSGTVTANAGTGTFTENVAQWGGAATSLGQKTMANSVPVVLASDQSSISVSFGAASNQLSKYNTTTALASSGETRHEVVPAAFPFYVDSVWSSASSKIKTETWVATAGLATAAAVRAAVGAVQYNVGFNSTANPNIEQPQYGRLSATTGNSVYVLITNLDNQAQNVYSNVCGHA
jgi:hypothetical protein